MEGERQSMATKKQALAFLLVVFLSFVRILSSSFVARVAVVHAAFFSQCSSVSPLFHQFPPRLLTFVLRLTRVFFAHTLTLAEAACHRETAVVAIRKGHRAGYAKTTD